MRKLLAGFILLSVLALPSGYAQGLYLGAELSQLATQDTADLSNRDLGAQLGLNFGGLGLRAAVTGNIAARSLDTGSLDALLNLPVFSGSSLYLGAGADVLDLNQLTSLRTMQAGGVDAALRSGAFAAHAVAGAEVRLGWLGVFGELQPVYRLGEGFTLSETYFLRTRAGLNIHF